MAPLIFTAAKGNTVAFDRDSTGLPCSACYMGYADWIFPGIEYFLSKGPMQGRECERIVDTPELAHEYVTSLRAEEARAGAIVFKPLKNFADDERPEAVILFANPDQMSALVFLVHSTCPLAQDRIVTGFASACASLFTMPLRFAQGRDTKAFWGLHDIAIRPSLPESVTSLAMPTEMYREICSIAGESFLCTERWEKVLERIRKSG